ncbi:MAG: hypothetical protein SA339_03160 [Methanomassiliicoccus sp.]|nr:hypothetical protein [Methanomassiliicoccus sp.]
MRLPQSRLLRTMVFAYIPVVISILIMIVLRADDLARENNDAGLGQSFLNPTTSQQAIVAGFTIWILGAFFVAFLAVMLYHVLRTRARFSSYRFIILTLALSSLLTFGLYITGNPFAPEGAFEMFACGIGYGLLVPLFYERKSTS